MGFKPNFSLISGRGVHYLRMVVMAYFEEPKMSVKRRQRLYWEMIEILLKAGVAISEYAVDPAVLHQCVAMLELFEKHGFNFHGYGYHLFRQRLTSPGLKGLLEFLDARKAMQRDRPEEVDSGMGAAIRLKISDETLDLLLARVTAVATPPLHHENRLGALAACAEAHNESFAIKLLEKGFKGGDVRIFMQWVQQSNNQRLKELAGLI
jgi:hypothetical protein